MRLLFIHGRSQGGKDKDALERIWVQTLRDGVKAAGAALPVDLKIDFAFYGDALDTYAAEAQLPGGDDVLPKGDGENSEAEAFTARILEEMAANSPEARAEADRLLPADGPQEKGPQNWRWVRAIVQAIDNRFPNLSEDGIKLLLRDVYLYVRIPFVQNGIDALIEELLTDEPTVIVSHSLGTVVGYNVIRKHRTRQNLLKFVTLGSPLGIKAIAAALGGVPENITAQGWYNAYDPHDIVALNPLEKPFFGTDPEIENNGAVTNGTDNRHGITGYLNDPDVAAAIVKALSAPPAN